MTIDAYNYMILNNKEKRDWKVSFFISKKFRKFDNNIYKKNS
jgi:hypothetical protein